MITTSPRDRLSAHLIQQSTPNYFPGSPQADPSEPPSRRSRCVRMDSAPSIGQKNNREIKPVARPLVSLSLSFRSNRAAKLFVLQIASCHTMKSRWISLPEEEIANICVEVPHTHNCLFTHNKMAFHKDSGGEKGENTHNHHIWDWELHTCYLF